MWLNNLSDTVLYENNDIAVLVKAVYIALNRVCDVYGSVRYALGREVGGDTKRHRLEVWRTAAMQCCQA